MFTFWPYTKRQEGPWHGQVPDLPPPSIQNLAKIHKFSIRKLLGENLPAVQVSSFQILVKLLQRWGVGWLGATAPTLPLGEKVGQNCASFQSAKY